MKWSYDQIGIYSFLNYFAILLTTTMNMYMCVHMCMFYDKSYEIAFIVGQK